MQYVYAVLWFAIAFLLIFKMGKENRIFYAGGALFTVFGVWWLIDAIAPDLKIFSGATGMIFKGLIVLVLVLCAFAYGKERKKAKTHSEKTED